MQKKKMGIIGCGWLGSKVARQMNDTFEIHATTRSKKSASNLSNSVNTVTIVDFSIENHNQIRQWEKIPSLDVILIMVPFSLRKNTLEDHQLKLKNLLNFIGTFNGQIFFTSSTGVYPKNPKSYSENDLPITSNEIEKSIKNFFPQLTILRLGGLMGGNRLLNKYAPKDLESPVNHVHYYDIASTILLIIKKGIYGDVYNLVAPLHPSKRQVIKAQTKGIVEEIDQPLGRIILSSKLEKELGFKFKYPDPRTFHL